MYDFNTLLKLQNSPMSKSPPSGMTFFPGMNKPTTQVNQNQTTEKNTTQPPKQQNTTTKGGLLFEMEDD